MVHRPRFLPKTRRIQRDVDGARQRQRHPRRLRLELLCLVDVAAGVQLRGVLDIKNANVQVQSRRGAAVDPIAQLLLHRARRHGMRCRHGQRHGVPDQILRIDARQLRRPQAHVRVLWRVRVSVAAAATTRDEHAARRLLVVVLLQGRAGAGQRDDRLQRKGHQPVHAVQRQPTERVAAGLQVELQVRLRDGRPAHGRRAVRDDAVGGKRQRERAQHRWSDGLDDLDERARL